MSGIFSGRTEPCNDNLGGISKIYLFTYVDYPRYMIEVNGNTLTSYPSTEIYEYETIADGNTINESLVTDETGISYDQNLSIVLKKIAQDFNNTTSLINKKVGCIVKERLGSYRIMGLYNGCNVPSISATTGGGYSDFNGYNITIEAKETKKAFYIDDLNAAGFVLESDVDFLDGLTHHYNFEETSGLITSDNIGVINGNIQGGVTLGDTGKVDNSFLYDGINGTVDFNSNLGITSFPFSVKLWAFMSDVSINQSLISGSLLTKYCGISIFNLSGGTVYVRFGDGGGTASNNRRDYRQSFPTLINGWNHIVVNFLSFGNIEIYANGINQTVTYVSGTGTTIDFNNAIYKLATNGTGTFYNLKIDELGVYNKILPADLVQEIYNRENSGLSIL